MKDLQTYGGGPRREIHYYEHAVSKAEFIDTFRTTRQLLARETGKMVALLSMKYLEETISK